MILEEATRTANFRVFVAIAAMIIREAVDATSEDFAFEKRVYGWRIDRGSRRQQKQWVHEGGEVRAGPRRARSDAGAGQAAATPRRGDETRRDSTRRQRRDERRTGFLSSLIPCATRELVDERETPWRSFLLFFGFITLLPSFNTRIFERAQVSCRR